ncbi:hypothetical protein SAMN04244572_01838 [Azotobacter beijerinckii]|uniref:Uncharacterized protein n=1 Tax=Azotobacter beijerinckii TaxID=170623 RepID=A0A1H6TWG6_9GAMM|nr:hypothetical protein [Azotobacter beijerinckii]SEI84351.1 hypothetical protein SAMN04244572_01838 [Azotobacter beijerinckii]
MSKDTATISEKGRKGDEAISAAHNHGFQRQRGIGYKGGEAGSCKGGQRVGELNQCPNTRNSNKTVRGSSSWPLHVNPKMKGKAVKAIKERVQKAA